MINEIILEELLDSAKELTSLAFVVSKAMEVSGYEAYEGAAFILSNVAHEHLQRLRELDTGRKE